MFEFYMLQPVTAASDLFDNRRHSFVPEPDLVELMRDPMTLAVMASDRVDRRELCTLLTQIRENRREQKARV